MSLENAPWHTIPEHMHAYLRDYIERGTWPGYFLFAVLTNNLKDAVGKGDDKNRSALASYVLFLTNYAPSACWGKPATVNEWMDRGGLEGIEREQSKQDDAA